MSARMASWNKNLPSLCEKASESPLVSISQKPSLVKGSVVVAIAHWSSPSRAFFN